MSRIIIELEFEGDVGSATIRALGFEGKRAAPAFGKGRSAVAGGEESTSTFDGTSQLPACPDCNVEPSEPHSRNCDEAMQVLVEACRTALEDCEAALAGDWEPDDDGFEATANVLRQALAKAEALWPGVREA